METRGFVQCLKYLLIQIYLYIALIKIIQENRKNAIDLSILNKLSFWDSLIISAAYSSKCKILMTEDLNHGQIINGVEIVNPLKI